MPFGWEGDKVRLVPLERGRHFDNCVRWFNDPQITDRLLSGDFPLTRLTEEEFFDRVSKQNDKIVAFGIETKTEEEEHIGVCGIHEMDFRHGVGTLGILIGRQALWNRGLGTDALATLIRYGFHTLGLRLILSEAFADNPASIRMQEKCGLKQVGLVPERYWKRGGYRDMILYALRRTDWQSATASP